MADALVSVALEKLTNVLEQQLAMFGDATGELRRLQKIFQRIKAILHDVERKQVKVKCVRLWLLELRQVAYDIDNLLEGFLEKDGSNDDDGYAGNRVLVAACLLSPYTCLDWTLSLYKLAHDIKEIRERLDDIATDKYQFNISQISSFGRDTRSVRSSWTMISLHMKEEMIGRDDEEKTLISGLVSGSSSGYDLQVHVITVVGLGELGKTTLGRKIYHNSKVRDQFKDALYWVFVSEDFDPMKLTKAIIEQVKGRGTSLSELHSLQNEFVEGLRGKCFLLILDDVWNDNKKKRNMWQPCLTSGNAGSRILVTTRVQKVTETAMNVAWIHNPKDLSDDHSWTLFRNIAFD